MKCKLRVEREILEFHPGTTTPFAPPGLVEQCQRRGGRLFAPAGAIIDDPDCWRIVLMGQADAADDECASKTGQTPEQRAATLQAAARLAAGILPEDFAKFDAGEILGYDGAGNYVKGPNWKQPVDDEEDEEEASTAAPVVTVEEVKPLVPEPVVETKPAEESKPESVEEKPVVESTETKEVQ